MASTSKKQPRSLRGRLVAAIVVMSLVPLLLATAVSYFVARSSLERSAFQGLEAVRNTRASRVSEYFESIRNVTAALAGSNMIADAALGFRTSFPTLAEAGSTRDLDRSTAEASVRAYYTTQFAARYKREAGRSVDVEPYMPTDDAHLMAQYLYIAANPRPLGSKHLLDRPIDDNSPYAIQHERLHRVLRDFVDRFGFYDIFVVGAASKRVVYSVFKEIDFGADLQEGALKDSGLARAARSALNAPETADSFAEDYRFYAPSYGAPATFLSAPIRHVGEVVGALVVQLPIDRINAIINEGSGLGESGECFLVGKDLLVRNDSRSADVSTILRTRIATDAVRSALDGVMGELVHANHRGQEVLVSYTPLDLLGHRHALVAELPTEEAFAAVRRLFWWMAALTLLLAAAALLVAFRLSRSLARPIGAVTDRLQAMAETMLSTSQEQQAGAAEQSAAAEETRRTFSGLLDATGKMTAIGGDVLSHAEVSQRNAQVIGERIDQLSRHTAHISEILTLVREIANKSEILALNAALEGTKAGEAGRGFSLVATQMQRLAEQVTGSVKKIEGLTGDITHASQGAVLAAEEAEKVSRLTTDSAGRISGSANEQQTGAKQVAIAMDEISSVAHDNVEAARRVVAASNELLTMAEGLRKSVGAKEK